MSRKKIIFISIIIFSLSINCFANISMDKQTNEFIAILKRFSSLMDRYYSVKANFVTNENNSEQRAIKINLENKVKFIEQTKNEWLQIKLDLENFIKNNQNSRWSDDANFVLALEYIIIHIPGLDYLNNGVNICKEMLLKYPEINLEGESKKILKKESFGLIYSLKDFKSSEILSFIRKAIIYDYIKENKISEAKKALVDLKSLGLTNNEYTELDSYIKAYEKLKKK